MVVFLVVVFALFGLVSLFSLCLFACLRSFTDWCIAHRQQSREQTKNQPNHVQRNNCEQFGSRQPDGDTNRQSSVSAVGVPSGCKRPLRKPARLHNHCYCSCATSRARDGLNSKSLGKILFIARPIKGVLMIGGRRHN